MKELTLAVAGLAGSVGTTVAAGLHTLHNGGQPTGLLTELSWPLGSSNGSSLASRLGLAPLSSVQIMGWDADIRPIAESVREKRILPPDVIDTVTPQLQKLVPSPALAAPRATTVAQAREELRTLRSRGQDVVVIDLLPAFPTPPVSAAHRDLAAFEKALMSDSPEITPSMAYAWLALSSGVPYLNFSPNVSAELPALRELADREKTPFCGKDGKTGQTLMKTALAPMLGLRGLMVRGWISANYLGNADGQNLADPLAAAEKLRNKAGVLDGILGYEVPNHIVDIRYYAPRGDFKESWDSIDFTGFCNVPMQLKVNFLCADSVLAAPLVIDAARLLDRAARARGFGPQEQLSLFFKHPIVDGIAEQDLFRQRTLFERWVDAVSDDPR
jgi:myo-inositol-1-phosphate synthase